MPKTPVTPRSLFAARLKQARALRGIDSQRALGVAMGLDKKLASSRINRYETEVRGIDLDGLGKLAETLDLPMAYLLAPDEHVANAIHALTQLSAVEREEAVRLLIEFVATKATTNK